MSKIKQARHYRRSAQVVALHALLASLFTWGPAGAYNWDQGYGVNSSISRNDNFRLNEDDPVSNTTTSVGVFANLQGTTETSSLSMTAGASANQQSDSSVDDSEKYYLTLGATRRDERWSGNLDLSLTLVPTTESEELDTGDLEDGDKKSYSLGSGVSYQVDERNSTYANLSFGGANYDTDSQTDYTNNSLSTGWVNQFSEISTVSINGSVSNYNPDDGSSSTVIGLQFGYGWNTSEATRYNLLLGYQEADGPNGTDSDGNSSLAVNHSIDERNNFSLFVGTGYAASGSGELRYQTDFNLSWYHALTERMQFILTAQGVSSEEDDGSDDRDFIGITSGGSYQYTREISLGANYSYRRQRSDNNDVDSNSGDTFNSGDADSHSVSLSLSYSHF